MIDIRKLKELVRLMVENDLTELDLQDQEETVSLKRGVGGAVMPAYAAPAAPAPVAAPAPAAADSAPAPASGGSDDGLVAIESPMVGTFYSAANPDSPPFVSVGESVSADTVVCIVEAMKVFNEIKAEASGTIAKVLVENGAAVEFGQPLFMIKPS
ncbi:MAG: acetyl-CoA carboxylase biotin carboxyl carrier protein [Planctomycetota bacterium]